MQRIIRKVVMFSRRPKVTPEDVPADDTTLATAEAQTVAVPVAPSPPAKSGTPVQHKDYFEVEALLESIRSGAIAALRGSYVVELHDKKKPIAHRQALPAKAFWTADQLSSIFDKLVKKYKRKEATKRFCKIFVGLSYRWLDKGRPDPDRFHLSRVGEAARLYISDKAKATSLYHLVFTPIGLKKVDFALFWDFASLYQGDRTPEQKELFFRGLKASNIWYGHRHTVMWMQQNLPDGFADRMEAVGLASTYAGSGWCYVEACLSSVLKPREQRLDLGARDKSSKTYADMMTECVAGREPPVTPERAALALRTEKQFTSRADVETVVGLYDDFFSAVAPKLDSLWLSNLGWGVSEVELTMDAVDALFPKVETLCFDGDAVLNVRELRGDISKPRLDLAGLGLTALSGCAIARLIAGNGSLMEVRLDRTLQSRVHAHGLIVASFDR